MQPITYMTSLLTFYLKGEIKSDQNFLYFKQPNTILQLIPLGHKKITVPVNQISTAYTSFKLQFKTFAVNLLLAILGLAFMGDSAVLGLILLLYGACGIIKSMETRLIVTMTSGHHHRICFLIFDKAKAESAEQQILSMIANRLDDTNNRQQADRMMEANRQETDRLVDALKNRD